jgi:hypothetical protein
MVAIIKSLCDEKGINIFTLEKTLGIANGNIRRWDVSKPNIEKVAAVADYFGVTVDYLLTGKQPTVTDGLSEEAIMIANIIDALPPDRRRLLLALVRELASAPADPASSSESP